VHERAKEAHISIDGKSANGSQQLKFVLFVLRNLRVSRVLCLICVGCLLIEGEKGLGLIHLPFIYLKICETQTFAGGLSCVHHWDTFRLISVTSSYAIGKGPLRGVEMVSGLALAPFPLAIFTTDS